MSQNQSEAEQTGRKAEENFMSEKKSGIQAKENAAEDREEKRLSRKEEGADKTAEGKRFFQIGAAAEKLWKNKWYQWFFTVLLILALGSGAFAYRYIEQETSVDSVIENYMQRFSAGDWVGMYEESGAEEAGVLYSVWETAMSSGRTNSVASYTYVLTGTEDGIQYYTVTYQENGSDEDKTLAIALRETGEVLYHFFKTYEVTAAPLVITGATVTVPEGITFTFDSLLSEELDVTEEEGGCVYALPGLMPGDYEVYLSGDTVEDQSFTVTVGENSRYFTWLEYEMDEYLAEEMEEHLSAVVISVLSEAVEYGEMERDFGSTIEETYGHDGLGDWNTLGTAISESLRLKIIETEVDDGDGSDGSEAGDSADGSGTGAGDSTDGSGTGDGDSADGTGDSDSGEDGTDAESEDAEILEVTQLSINDSETSSYEFVYPDRCKVKLVLACSYTASSEIDILDPDAEEEQTRTGTLHMEFVATYLVDAEEWQILDCTCTSSYTMDAPAEEESAEEEETESE